MHLGVVFPHQTIGSDPGVLRAFAQHSESLGYSHIVVYDHVLGAVRTDREPPFEGPYSELDAFHEPLTLISWWAGFTERIGFMTGILILPQRQTALAAKQLAQIEILSPGRLRAGLGIGWNYVEYESLGVPFRRRGPLLEEQVNLMRRLWTEPVIDYTGEFHRIDRAGLLPLPASTPPIWFGGFSDAQLNRCGRLGDGFMFMRASSLARRAVQTIRDVATEHGRDPEALGFEIQLRDNPDTWSDAIDQWSADGGTHLSLYPAGEGSEILDNLERYAERFGLTTT